MNIIYPLLVFALIAIVETFIATLDTISIMRKKLLLNFVLVFSGAFLGLVVIRYVAMDPSNWNAMLTYSGVAALTSVVTLHYDSVIRKKRRANRRKKMDTTYTGNEGEHR